MQCTMAIPDYQTCMLPLLRHVADGKEHSLRESEETLASQFSLTAAERGELLVHLRKPGYVEAKFTLRRDQSETKQITLARSPPSRREAAAATPQRPMNPASVQSPKVPARKRMGYEE